MTKLFETGLKGCLMNGWFGGVAGLALWGCSAPSTMVRPTALDLRGNATVSGSEAQPFLAGPMRLLHVNADGRTAPRFSHVWKRDGAVDCHRGTPLAWDGESSVDIADDELLCVAADSPVRLLWHGRPAVQSVPAAPAQASLR